MVNYIKRVKVWRTDGMSSKRFLENVERLTGLRDFGIYMNKLLTVDAFFLNEDRHTHNIAVLMNGEGKFAYCPIFDNGAGLLSKQDVRNYLERAEEYPVQIRQRVEKIVFYQMNKYAYLF